MDDVEKIRLAVEEGTFVGRVEMLLAGEVRRLKSAIEAHYNVQGDDRCWIDDMKLYHDALGISFDPYATALPPKGDFLESCRRYYEQRQQPAAVGRAKLPGCMTIAQLTEEVRRLPAENKDLYAANDDYRAQIEVEIEETRRLTAERDAMLADKARLDWLEENRVEVSRDPDDLDDDEGCAELALTVWREGSCMGSVFHGDTLMEAIDKAMAETGATGPQARSVGGETEKGAHP